MAPQKRAWRRKKKGKAQRHAKYPWGNRKDVCQCAVICVGEGYSEEFEVKVGVHQGSVISPLLLIIVLEAFSREFRSGSPGRTSLPMTLFSQSFQNIYQNC